MCFHPILKVIKYKCIYECLRFITYRNVCMLKCNCGSDHSVCREDSGEMEKVMTFHLFIKMIYDQVILVVIKQSDTECYQVFCFT